MVVGKHRNRGIVSLEEILIQVPCKANAQQCLKNRKHTVLVRTVIIGISIVGLAQLEELRGLSRLLGEIRVMVGGLMSVMMTGMIIWVLVVLAGHGGV